LLEQWIQNGFSFIRERWLKGAFRLGEKIKVNKVEGIFEDLDNDGTLILNTENGILKIKSGDVFV
jgi:BirA family biotin operon repressor/biotin-[acetyl-CoA-carboxylase] ligase